jgi:hypothetical protein
VRVGESPSGKASVFGADIRWFESTLPSQSGLAAILASTSNGDFIWIETLRNSARSSPASRSHLPLISRHWRNGDGLRGSIILQPGQSRPLQKRQRLCKRPVTTQEMSLAQ